MSIQTQVGLNSGKSRAHAVKGESKPRAKPKSRRVHEGKAHKCRQRK